ncbi:MAG: 16S rRNA (uracil(1498)-N(3))-methyltransferase [Metamycoplasmataceae bacterium]|uniref:16S rRNA (uracil(1498)-N(3))-methyltransferase n=1 Tax=Mycoplasmopsis lipophila TaxID=2117 RepID=UPI00387396F9
MFRFFVNKKNNDYFELDKDLINHLKVIRLRPDEKILLNFKNEFYECVVEENKAKIIKKLNINHEYNNSVILALPIIKMKNFELVLQKATELGVTKIIPTITEYCDHSLIKYIKDKQDRFLTILKNASEQSFRNKIPELEQPQLFQNVLKTFWNFHKYLAYENYDNDNYDDFILKTNSIFFIGPEGGFSQKEIEIAKKENCQFISLGKRILKAETACITVLSRIKK